MKKKQLNIFILFALAFSFWQCASSEKSGLLGQVYHNTTAQYNAYFLGSERLTAAEAKLTAATPDDYNQILTFFPSSDTSITSQFRPQFEDVITKASFAIKKHPKSRWTGDSYILVGKARYYLGDYDEAIRTFRFVNTSSKKDQVRFRSQVWLMRSFIAQRDFESADAVSDLLKKVRLNKNNAIHLFLNRADYYLMQKDTSLAITNLKLAIPIMKNKDYRARARFILAQLYQQTKQDKQAYEVYTKILKKNPPYELGFYSKLNLGQVTELSDPNDKARIEKYYSKLLKDAKNIDFRDKIYYEMAQFALKQQQPEKALDYLRQAIKATSTNETQKSYSYLLAGKIYYEKLQKYSLASAYYDSAVQVMPPNSAEYLAASERRDILKEFATQYTTIQTQDSLQALAKLDTASLNKKINAIIETAAKKAQQEQEQQRQQNNNGSDVRNAFNLNPGQNGRPNNRPNSFSTSSGGTWYFDNPTSVARARAEFTQRWGNRQLQDNWRVSDREASAVAQNANDPAAGNASTGATPDSTATANNSASFRKDLLQNIPIGAEKMQASNNQVEEAMFGLATIYQQQLNEPVKAAETYEKLLQRFPATKHKSEAYYSLFLINQEQKNDRAKTYADLVKREFPGSKYAKLIDQPDYLEQVSANNQRARQLYDSAFVNYRRERYPVAYTLVSQVQKQYPDNELADRVAFLQVLLTGRTQKPAVFKTAVQQFIEKYPGSTLLPKAEEILTSFEAYESGQLSEAEFNKTHSKKTKEPFTPEELAAQQTNEEQVPSETEVQPNQRRGRPRNEAVPEIAAEPSDSVISNDSIPTDSVAVAEEPVAEQETPSPDQPQDSLAETSSDPVPNSSEPAPNNSTPKASPAVTVNSPATPPVVAAPIYAMNVAQPHVVVIAYPKTHPAFKDVYTKMAGYNTRFNQADNLSIDSTTFNGTTNLLVIKEFDTGKKAVNYATKQKAPQSPLSKIRGIEFATFAISSENLPILLKEGKLEDYLTFYKNNYF
ncbi:type IX secretion system periplasmic lipoprotein PorW/SprE [Adhaeribacter radiodurans]|uniref:Tetratricopeptide repeat protein n=1 Tax=Adhaeribacter radiodurans TaxID=2745197 RepID=A0A7L7L274_9BACT|nr:tetratricopeptide repeat protein [Adhaeribacter radiodurans]QMU26896.1 tetratricopeptide repeat protein [Adhaeribacter radiodurans]